MGEELIGNFMIHKFKILMNLFSNFLLTLLLLVSCSTAFSQTGGTTSENDSIEWEVVEQMPEFPGGELELFKYLGSNTKYPELAMSVGISGTSYVQFVVEKDGSISNVETTRGIGGGCDEEAVRVVQDMPKWNPGMHKGKPVRVTYKLPVKFSLRDVFFEAVYVGGPAEMDKFIMENLIYPEKAKKKNVGGTVLLNVEILTNGAIGNVKVLSTDSKLLNAEAKHVVESMPKWKPASKGGKNIVVGVEISVVFELPE